MTGIRVQYNLSRPDGKRVVGVEVRTCPPTGSGCTLHAPYSPLDHGAIYKVVIPSFLTRGGDGYSMIANVTKTLYNLGNALLFL